MIIICVDVLPLPLHYYLPKKSAYVNEVKNNLMIHMKCGFVSTQCKTCLLLLPGRSFRDLLNKFIKKPTKSHNFPPYKALKPCFRVLPLHSTDSNQKKTRTESPCLRTLESFESSQTAAFSVENLLNYEQFLCAIVGAKCAYVSRFGLIEVTQKISRVRPTKRYNRLATTCGF